MSVISLRRLWALCRKESFQIVRDPSSVLIAFILPVMLLFILGYAVNLDSSRIRIGVLLEDSGAAALRFEQALSASPQFEVKHGVARASLMHDLASGKIRGLVIIPHDFSSHFLAGQGRSANSANPATPALIQVLSDGSEPNTASFVAAYVQGSLETWLQSQAQDRAEPGLVPPIEVQIRTWYNPSNVSSNFLVPGSIAVVMAIIGILLTSLVVAREWERGTMEALLATPVTRFEVLLSKIIPYYVLGMCAMVLCWLVAVYIMRVPFRGSFLALFILSSLFLGSALGQGLFLSTALRSQFNAAQAALTAGFLPALMLSGFIFEIASMPPVLQWFTRIIPARYFTNSLQTLFQAGDVGALLIPNALCLSLLTLFWLGLTVLKTKRTLD